MDLFALRSSFTWNWVKMRFFCKISLFIFFTKIVFLPSSMAFKLAIKLNSLPCRYFLLLPFAQPPTYLERLYGLGLWLGLFVLGIIFLPHFFVSVSAAASDQLHLLIWLLNITVSNCALLALNWNADCMCPGFYCRLFWSFLFSTRFFSPLFRLFDRPFSSFFISALDLFLFSFFFCFC